MTAGLQAVVVTMAPEDTAVTRQRPSCAGLAYAHAFTDAMLMSTDSPIHPQDPVRWILRPLRPELAAEPQARDWLASELEMAVPALGRDEYGRPRLPPLPGFHGLDVSWSHSGDQLLVAIGHGVQVGADLERIRPRPRAMALAERFFHPAESAWLQAQAPEQRELAFIRLWCAKEAVLKAHGRGIAFGLERFLVGPSPERGLQLVQSDPSLGDAQDWYLHEFVPLPGYRAALAWHRPSGGTRAAATG